MTTSNIGLHHITAIAADAALSKHIFSSILGLRLVKKSVTSSDPNDYHLYFGDKFGSPGSLLTLVTPRHNQVGRIGAGQATILQLSVPANALDFWQSRLRANSCQHIVNETVFGDQRSLFQLANGLLVALVEDDSDERQPWISDDIGPGVAIRGLYGVTLAQQSPASLPRLLTETFGYVQEDVETVGSTKQYRFRLPKAHASVIDLQVDPSMVRGLAGTGTIDHISLKVGSDSEQIRLRQALIDAGLMASEITEDQYSTSVTARTPGGILIKTTLTKAGGFMIDEDLENLGTSLCLPADLIPQRQQIERLLPCLD